MLLIQAWTSTCNAYTQFTSAIATVISLSNYGLHASACRLDLPRIEGLGMSFLCSNLVDVRKAALDVLFTLRELHGKLLQAGGRSTPVTPVTPAPSISNPPTPGNCEYWPQLQCICFLFL